MQQTYQTINLKIQKPQTIHNHVQHSNGKIVQELVEVISKGNNPSGEKQEKLRWLLLSLLAWRLFTVEPYPSLGVTLLAPTSEPCTPDFNVYHVTYAPPTQPLPKNCYPEWKDTGMKSIDFSQLGWSYILINPS